ncbi:MAG: DUF72 domain-containing protein [Candidatus Eisenbacteria bacterium]|nr:DUF72 domain-containing protein [Candidatus Eisenbacteria bacterium]
MIWIGTSGYSFEDWGGVFYPPGLARGKRLDYYVQHFSCVEINSTYYRLPHPVVIRNIERKTPAGFRFFVKMHKDVTHGGVHTPLAFQSFLDSIEPLLETEKLHGLLGQFPWAFRPSPASWEHLEAIRAGFADLPVYIEFRHSSWATRETFARLRGLGLGFVSVDEPGLPGLFPRILEETDGTGYVRFHGRNAQTWWSKERGAGRPDRYDYDYPDKELLEWVERVRDFSSRTTDTYLFFNNCHAGRAARNAMRMSELLGLPLHD